MTLRTRVVACSKQRACLEDHLGDKSRAIREGSSEDKSYSVEILSIQNIPKAIPVSAKLLYLSAAS